MSEKGTTRRKAPVPKPVALALQGGGSHGAFAWGVLDRLLEDGRLSVEGISASSAGAMNAVVLAAGFQKNGPDGARQALHDFWQDISRLAQPCEPMLQPTWLGGFNFFSSWSSSFYYMMNLMPRVLSPYQFNPFNLNPLRDVLERHVDFDALGRDSPIRLYLCATNVETGKICIFSGSRISVESVLASACLPMLFQSVEINGKYYWDGGYVGNPAIFPLIYNCSARDIVVVHVNPIVRPGVPVTTDQILNRMNEVSFNSSLMREVRAISFVTGMIRKGQVDCDAMKEVLMHSVRSDETMAALGSSSKLNVDWNFLCSLRDKGRQVAAAWLESNYKDIGQRSSFEIDGDPGFFNQDF